MTEFGHKGAIFGGCCIDSWGAGPFVIEAKGKIYEFEDSDRFGPALLKKNGDLKANPYPPERSPFWAAHRKWRKQGRRLKDDGKTCVWEQGKPTIVRQTGPRKDDHGIVQVGDDDDEEPIVLGEEAVSK